MPPARPWIGLFLCLAAVLAPVWPHDQTSADAGSPPVVPVLDDPEFLEAARAYTRGNWFLFMDSIFRVTYSIFKIYLI